MADFKIIGKRGEQHRNNQQETDVTENPIDSYTMLHFSAPDIDIL